MRNMIDNIIIYILYFAKTVIDWLPIMSVFIFLGAIIYGLLSHAVGYAVMLGIPLTFCILKTWADASTELKP